MCFELERRRELVKTEFLYSRLASALELSVVERSIEGFDRWWCLIDSDFFHTATAIAPSPTPSMPALSAAISDFCFLCLCWGLGELLFP